MKGFERGRNLKKVGLKAQDTAELFFDQVRVPASNLLGEENKGFYMLMQGKKKNCFQWTFINFQKNSHKKDC